MRAAGEHLVGKRNLGKRQDLTNFRLERAIRGQPAKLVQCRTPHVHNEVMPLYVCFRSQCLVDVSFNAAFAADRTYDARFKKIGSPRLLA